MMKIKVARIPGTIYDIELDYGGTAAQALQKANISVARNDFLKVNGVLSPADTVLNEGDRVVVAEDAKGNA